MTKKYVVWGCENPGGKKYNNSLLSNKLFFYFKHIESTYLTELRVGKSKFVIFLNVLKCRELQLETQK